MTRGRGEGDTTSPRGHTALPLPPVPQFSSSEPSMQSASASQRQRMGMQCPFLHLNWSNSQRGVQSFCRGRARDTVSRDRVATARPLSYCHPQALSPRASGRGRGGAVSPSRRPVGAVPRRSRRRSRGPHRISICPRCSGRWHTRTRSRSRAGVLGTENTGCALSVGTGCEGRGCPWPTGWEGTG